jgi:hypothetical protein
MLTTYAGIFQVVPSWVATEVCVYSILCHTACAKYSVHLYHLSNICVVLNACVTSMLLAGLPLG